MCKITDDECRAIVRKVKDEDVTLIQVGRDVLPSTDLKSPTYYVVGSQAYYRGLVLLDEYDADIRPEPGRIEMGDIDGKAVVYYHPDRFEYEVVLDDLSECFRATYRPTFGVDVADAHQAAEVADRLRDRKAEAGR